MRIRLTFSTGRQWVIAVHTFHWEPAGKLALLTDTHGNPHSITDVVLVTQE